MRTLHGPFVPDPHIAGIVLASDDSVWFINRPANHLRDRGFDYGVLELIDVRYYRRRTLHGPPHDDPPYSALEHGGWALELEQSTFLEHCVSNDPHRSREHLAAHRHFVIFDGQHFALDVVARRVAMRGGKGPLPLDRDRLFGDEPAAVRP
jgi:hypothetical protein